MSCSVPQGSVKGPGDYTDYTKPVGEIVRKNKVNPHFYADDSQLKVHFVPSDEEAVKSAIQSIETCCSEVRKWMMSNLLKLNDEKSEVIIFGTKSQLSQLNIDTIKVGDTLIKQKKSAGNIGV